MFNIIRDPRIPDLVLIENFISEEEERQLVQYFDNKPWSTEISRRIQQYGYSFSILQFEKLPSETG